MIIFSFLARFFSTVFHPLLIPTYGFAIYLFGNRYLFSAYALPQKGFELFRVLLLTAFFPAFSIVLMAALKFIEHTNLRRREDRILPYIATGFFYIWAYVVYQRTQEPAVFQAILLGACISVFVGLLVNSLWGKVSMHTSGVGALATTAMFLVPMVSDNITWVFYTVVLAAGLVGSSRLALKAHTGKEVLAGYFVGYLSAYAGFAIALR
ncbi:MAG: phosphatase PAP2 family protein [Bacteroidetes bacterium]|nr:phosphatase PAP2 family protein [Bacteroidota bacterium]